jgi:hypothetical protein
MSSVRCDIGNSMWVHQRTRRFGRDSLRVETYARAVQNIASPQAMRAMPATGSETVREAPTGIEPVSTALQAAA